MKKKPKKLLKPRTRNHETMTEAQFWGMIRSALRRLSIYWKPIKAKKVASRTRYKGTNKRQIWAYACEACGGEFREKEIEVDHTKECGALNAETAGVFIERLFCEVEGFQILCKACHASKTQKNRKVE